MQVPNQILNLLPNKESGALKGVKSGDDFESSIIQIDKTLLANYRVTLKNNAGIKRIQEMLQGQGQARAKELRMESGGQTTCSHYYTEFWRGGGKDGGNGLVLVNTSYRCSCMGIRTDAYKNLMLRVGFLNLKKDFGRCLIRDLVNLERGLYEKRTW